MNKHLLLLIALTFTLVGCQTQEQIRREQMIDNLSMQMVQNQQLTASTTVKLQNLEEQLSLLTGEVENKEYQQMMSVQSEFRTIKEKVELMEALTKTQADEIGKLRSEVSAQKKYLDDILKTLSALSGEGGKKKSSKSLSPYETAMGHYTKGRYAQAKPLLINLEKDSKIKGNQRSRVLHNLGMIAYMDKNWGQAQGYFGQLITEFPDASQVRNGLLFIAKSFKEDKKSEEAKQMCQELIRRFPKSKQAGEAKKLLSSL